MGDLLDDVVVVVVEKEQDVGQVTKIHRRWLQSQSKTTPPIHQHV